MVLGRMGWDDTVPTIVIYGHYDVQVWCHPTVWVLVQAAHNPSSRALWLLLLLCVCSLPTETMGGRVTPLC